MAQALKRFIYFSLFFLVGFLFFSQSTSAQAQAIPAPTLITPPQHAITGNIKPLIIGLTKDGTLVKIFVDGVYAGKTEILNHLSGTANFAYQSVELSRGQHEIYAIAEDGTGQVSLQSNLINFKIEWPMPAPTMIKTVVNKNSSSVRPFITGLAKNNSLIKVYIDQKYNGEFLVKNHLSGTANFAYQPTQALTRGNHQVYTVAKDSRGKTSIKSNTINFSVKIPAIAQAVQEENKQAVAGVKDTNQEIKNSEANSLVIATSTSQITEEKLTQNGQAGANLEEQNDKNIFTKIKLSALLFTLFFLGVIGWLLWVNRELIKERRTQKTEAEKKDEKVDDQKNKLL